MTPKFLISQIASDRSFDTWRESNKLSRLYQVKSDNLMIPLSSIYTPTMAYKGFQRDNLKTNGWA